MHGYALSKVWCAHRLDCVCACVSSTYRYGALWRRTGYLRLFVPRRFSSSAGRDNFWSTHKQCNIHPQTSLSSWACEWGNLLANLQRTGRTRRKSKTVHQADPRTCVFDSHLSSILVRWRHQGETRMYPRNTRGRHHIKYTRRVSEFPCSAGKFGRQFRNLRFS